MKDELQARFARLESHIAHLDPRVGELHGVVIEQAKLVKRLRKQEPLQSRTLATSVIEQAKANNPRPPHDQRDRRPAGPVRQTAI